MREKREIPDSRVARQETDLPSGVTLADWSLERVRVQNPSIRSYLGCIRLLEEVLDSNYAILNCSPDRLLRVWHQVEEVRELIRSELVPTLEEPSVIPSLQDARRHAIASHRELAEAVLTPMVDYGHSLRADQLPGVRKLLCVSIGKIYAFLRDSFGEIVANDPRSRHDADYFLSRRFAQDIEESEWLYSSVYELMDLATGLEKTCSVQFDELLPRMRQEQIIPSDEDWGEARRLLETLLGELVPKLKDVLSLRGIRVNDMESLEVLGARISGHCRSLVDVYSVGRDVIENLKGAGGPTMAERGQKVRDLATCHRVVSGRLVEELSKLMASLRTLATDSAQAKAGIERRRALVLAKDLTEFRVGADRPVRRIR
jgi:hypothetical protein